ncbi:MAG: ThuA domain-containing protein [Mycobacterium sp.]
MASIEADMPTLLFVTEVAPYVEGSVYGPGPSGVHAVLPQVAVALKELGRLEGLELVVVDDVRHLEPSALAEVRVLALFTIGETPFSEDLRRSIESRWRAGHLSVLGLHSSSDACVGWPAYRELLGARFDGHPWTQTFEIEVVDRAHPATAALGERWPWHDEVYLFKDLEPDVRVLLRLDPGPLDLSVPEARIPEHGLPLAWCRHHNGASRSFYSALGHVAGAWERPDHLRFLHGALRWLLDREAAP